MPDNAQTPGEPGTERQAAENAVRAADPAPAGSQPVDANAVRAQERERIAAINALVDQFKLERSVADDLVGRGVLIDEARKVVLDKLAERDARGVGHSQVSMPAGGLDATVTRERLRAGFAKLFTEADLLLSPIHAVPPERRTADSAAQTLRDAVLPFTVPQNMTGLPSAAVPVGFDENGLPIGLQLTGPPHGEGRVLAAAEALFSATASAREGSASSR